MRAHKLLPYLPIIQKPVKTRFLRDKLLFPSLLSIELTNHCNASCIMCPRKEMTRKKGHMEFSLFKKIINDCRSQPLKKINLFWFGESLLYPKFL
ncbi:MAG: radical SAM protein, partial [bacterium]